MATKNLMKMASGEMIKSIELVYFDITARGELTRLAFAASGMWDKLKDTRLPLFMESQRASDEWSEKHADRAPFGFVPYLNVVYEDKKLGEKTRQVSGDGVVEAFAGRMTNLMGANEVEAAVVTTISNEAVGLQGPQLTRAGLIDRGDVVLQLCRPSGPYGEKLMAIEKYTARVVGNKQDRATYHVVGGKISLGDLAIFNCLDEVMNGPRSDKQLAGVEKMVESSYPVMYSVYKGVAEELKDYIKERRNYFVTPEAQAYFAASSGKKRRLSDEF